MLLVVRCGRQLETDEHFRCASACRSSAVDTEVIWRTTSP